MLRSEFFAIRLFLDVCSTGGRAAWIRDRRGTALGCIPSRTVSFFTRVKDEARDVPPCVRRVDLAYTE